MAYSMTDAIRAQQGQLDQVDPNAYSGTFRQAYQGLSQPGEGHDQVISEGTKALADAFIERMYEKTGKLPDENQVHDFVAGNLDSSFASNYIKGTLNQDQIKGQIVDPYLQGNNLAGGADPTGVEGRASSLNDQLNKYYNDAAGYVTNNVNDQYAKQKTTMADELASQGLLGQGTSRYSLNALEGSKNQALSQGLAGLAGQKAAGQMDISKTIEGILQGQRSLNQNQNQFQQNLQFSKNQAQNQQDLLNRQLGLAGAIGKAQAGAQSNDGLSGAAGGALAGAGTGAAVGSVFPGVGTAIGAGIGGLVGGGLGYFGSRR